MANFREFSQRIACESGSSRVFIWACASIVVWAITGPVFHFSDTWQLVVNTITNVVTFLMVFLIQNTVNRDAKAMQLKLNELIRAVGPARNSMLDLENCTDEELSEIHAEFAALRSRIIDRRALRTAPEKHEAAA